MNITDSEVLINIPFVKEDAPEWMRVCPFCGAVDMIHEADGLYICHECLANCLERDTPTERQIQVLHLNHGKMSVPGEGEMSIVFRKIERYISIVEASFEDETVTFRDKHGENLRSPQPVGMG